MAPKKKKRPLRPRTPARVRKRTKQRKRARAAHQHPELAGLALATTGLFLATLLYLGWEGGLVGEKIEQALRDAVGGAAFVVPVALIAIGGLMLLRSALVDVNPFRTGLGVAGIGLLTTLGSDHGGVAGDILGGGLAKLLGDTGSFLVGVTALAAGALLLTGASAGAILRGSGTRLRRAHTAARRSLERPERPEPEPLAALSQDVVAPPAALVHEPPVDVVEDYPDVVSVGLAGGRARRRADRRVRRAELRRRPRRG